MGSNGETAFKRVAEAKGFSVEKSSIKTDIHNHIDYYITKDKNTISFDVKCEKSDEKIYVEFMNVQGNLGWIYGDQQCIAFVFNEEIIIVKRRDLLNYMQSKMDVASKPTKTSIEIYFRVYGDESYYKTFRRYGRSDVVVLMPKSDLLEVNHIVWK